MSVKKLIGIHGAIPCVVIASKSPTILFYVLGLSSVSKIMRINKIEFISVFWLLDYYRGYKRMTHTSASKEQRQTAGRIHGDWAATFWMCVWFHASQTMILLCALAASPLLSESSPLWKLSFSSHCEDTTYFPSMATSLW